MQRPKWTSTDPADVTNLAVLEGIGGGAMPAGFGLDLVRGSGEVLPGTPNDTANWCSDPFELVVPLRAAGAGRWKYGQRVIGLRTTTTQSLIDRDRLQLRCLPPPAP